MESMCPPVSLSWQITRRMIADRLAHENSSTPACPQPSSIGPVDDPHPQIRSASCRHRRRGARPPRLRRHTGRRAAGTAWRRPHVAVELALRGAAAVDRAGAAVRRAFLACALRQGRGSLGVGVPGAVHAVIRRDGDGAPRRARDPARIRPVPRHPVRAVHHRRRHLPARSAGGNARTQHRPPGARCRPGEHHGDDRRVDAADPAAPDRQRIAAAQGARGRVLHPAGRQRRRRAVAAGRSAALHRLSQGHRFLLDDAPARPADRVPGRRAARHVLGARHAGSTAASVRRRRRAPAVHAWHSKDRSTSC